MTAMLWNFFSRYAQQKNTDADTEFDC